MVRRSVELCTNSSSRKSSAGLRFLWARRVPGRTSSLQPALPVSQTALRCCGPAPRMELNNSPPVSAVASYTYLSREFARCFCRVDRMIQRRAEEAAAVEAPAMRAAKWRPAARFFLASAANGSALNSQGGTAGCCATSCPTPTNASAGQQCATHCDCTSGNCNDGICCIGPATGFSGSSCFTGCDCISGTCAGSSCFRGWFDQKADGRPVASWGSALATRRAAAGARDTLALVEGQAAVAEDAIAVVGDAIAVAEVTPAVVEDAIAVTRAAFTAT
jgi:hypothetical protein